jgi:hypothetical protein
MPITVAVAGRSETRSAYVARRIRAIASWSKTYGITDDEIPTPIPAARATGSTSAGAASHPPTGSTKTQATSIAAARPSIPPIPLCATRWASTMYSANSAAFRNANITPTGSPSSRTSVRRYTPPTAAASATPLRAVRIPSAASTITGRNSIAATVPSGSRSIAM